MFSWAYTTCRSSSQLCTCSNLLNISDKEHLTHTTRYEDSIESVAYMMYALYNIFVMGSCLAK